MKPLDFDKSTIFESERLAFRGITIEDAENLIRWRSREDVYLYAFNPRPVTHCEHLAWFAKYMKNEQAYRAIITEKITNKDIGMVGGEFEDGAFVISYHIGEPEHRGKGYAGEAIQSLIAFVRKASVTIVYAYVHEDNEASISCLRKIGFMSTKKNSIMAMYKYI